MAEKRGRGRPRKPCDGTAQDYLRHKRRGEEACYASKRAWALFTRRYKSVFVKVRDMPYHPDDEYLHRKPYRPGEPEALSGTEIRRKVHREGD